MSLNRRERRRLASAAKKGQSPHKDISALSQMIAKAWQLMDGGNLKAARKLINDVLEIAPNFADAHMSMGSYYSRSGLNDEAIKSYHEAVRLKPDSFQAWFNLGNAQHKMKDISGAIFSYQKACEIRPEAIEAIQYTANLLLETDAVDQAIEVLKTGLKKNPDVWELHQTLASLYSREQIYDRAVRHYIKALKLQPDSAMLHAQIGEAYEGLWESKNAEKFYQKALKLKPELYSLYGRLVKVSNGSGDLVLLDQIKPFLELPDVETGDKAELHFACAAIYERQKSFDKAFEHYAIANRHKKQLVTRTPTVDTDWVVRLINAFTVELFKERKTVGHASEKPIFIVGMPRSGKTTVERILATHPKIHSGRELTTLWQIVDELINTPALPEYPEGISKLADEKIISFAQRTLLQMERGAGTAARIITTLPTNYLRLGLISFMFPKARIIHCQRDPMDNCADIFFKSFNEKTQTFPWDMNIIGRHYRQYHGLMKHWDEVLPNKIFNVKFEELVEQPEEFRQSLVSYCGLESDDKTPHYFPSSNINEAGTVWPVSQDKIKSVVGRWKPFSDHLQPLKDALADLVDDTTG